MTVTHRPAPLVMNFWGPHRWHFGQTIRSGGKLALNSLLPLETRAAPRRPRKPVLFPWSLCHRCGSASVGTPLSSILAATLSSSELPANYLTTKDERSQSECEISTTSPLSRIIWLPDAAPPGRTSPATQPSSLTRSGRCPGLPWTLYALSANPWRRRTPAFGHTNVVLDDGQELIYYWCNNGITLMAACDRVRAAEMAPQAVMLMDLPTYDAYCASRTGSD